MRADDEAFFRHVAREFEEGFATGDVDRIMQFYADTYVDVNLRSPVQTKAERRAYYAQLMKQRGIRAQLQVDDVLVRGDMALVRGTVMVSYSRRTEEGGPAELRYLEVYERLRDGAWRVIWGMDGPVQEYVAAQRVEA